MTFPNLATSARSLRGVSGALVIALLLGASVGVGLLSVQQSEQFAAWWPSAGIDVVAALIVRKRYRMPVLALITLTTFPVSLIAGRPLLVAVVGSLAIAAEVWIVTRFSVDRNDQPRLTTTRDLIRFFVGIGIGSIVMGLTVALVTTPTDPSDALVVGTSVMASHASAIVVIAPIALVNRLKTPLGQPHIRALHGALLAASVFVAFAPGSISALAFLPVPFLAWAAFSFSMSVALTELIATSAFIVILTTVGGGPFNDTTGMLQLETAALLELYVITLSVTTLLIAAARNERQILEDRNLATARLLYDGFEQTQNGFAIIREDQGTFRVMEANNAATVLLPSSLARNAAGHTEVVIGSGLFELLGELTVTGTEQVTVTGDDELPVMVTISNVTHSTFGRILLVSIVDQRPIRAAQEAADIQLAREKAVVEELRALNQQKDDFVSSVTHELRTPITTVIGFSEELESTPLDDTQKSYVTIIQRNAERLLSVIEDVLMFSRRSPGRPSAVTLVDVDIVEVIRLVLDDLHHSLLEKRIEVVTRFDAESALVRAQVNDLTRVIINLVTNAVKFTPANGRVEVAVSVIDEVVQVTISDTGPGIAPSDLDKVFERFYRASRAAHDGVPGTGLGLAIVRDLVDDLNGSINLESDGTNGTTARLTLPLAAHVTRV